MQKIRLSFCIALVALVIIVAGAATLLYKESSDSETVYPLGDSSYEFFRDADTGTEFRMIISGNDHVENLDSDSNHTMSDYSIEGEVVVKVYKADETYLYLNVTITMQIGEEEPLVTVEHYKFDRNEETVLGSGYALSNPSEIPKPTVEKKWGSHSLDCDNYIETTHSGLHSIFIFKGLDDRVCYCINEYIVTKSTSNGVELTNERTLIYTLDSMDFRHL